MEIANGQYGKRNPLFMYQRTAGHSIRSEVNISTETEQGARIFMAEPSQSGERRCGALQK